MNDEMLALLKENNELLHRIADYIDKADSPKYTYNRQTQSLAINLAADFATETMANNPRSPLYGNTNKQ